MSEHEPRPGTADAEQKQQELRQDGQELREVTPLTVIGSVFRAWFGVQTEENRKRDFSSNNPVPFIVAGIVFALIMIIGVIIAVNVAMSGVK